MEPLRVAIVAPYDLSAPGGVNTHIRAQAVALRRLGHDVRIWGPASRPLSDGERSLGRTVAVDLGGTRSGLGVDPRGLVAVERMLREAYDVVHVHEPFTPIVPWHVVLRSRAPLVGTFHVHREEGHRLYAAMSWMLRPLSRRLRARIAVSESARRTTAKHFPGEYVIVPNGIDVERFATPCERPPGLDDDGPVVLCVGRLEPRKGVAHLVRAMRQVSAEVPDARLVVVGDGPERASLTTLAIESGVRASFVGAVTDAELPGYLQGATVVCSPALGGESFGIVLLEALAASRPIVASRIEGYSALVGDADCGPLVPPGDPGALARALIDLLRDEPLRRALAERGRRFVEAFDWPVIAARLEGIYRAVMTPGW